MATENKTLTQLSVLLTNQEVNKALSKWFKEPTEFTHWEHVGEMGKGDSYLSDVYRIKIHGKSGGNSRHLQLIVKTIPKNICRRLTFRSHDFFRNEINFYLNVLPVLLKFQSNKQMTEPYENYTNVFLALTDGTHDVICLEDVSLQNYGNPTRQEGIDYEHCQLTVQVLAKFHALSFAMRDQKPEEFAKLSNVLPENYYDPTYWDWYEKFWKRLCITAIDAVEREYPNTVYVDKIKEFAIPERYLDMIQAVQDKTNGVISQGDCWTVNFLYKYENKQPIDAKMIDFQLARCASPVLDLSFAIYACTDQNLREKHYDALLKDYYDVLSKQISEMGSDPKKVYPWSTFMEEVKKYSYFGLAFSFESTPFIILAPEDAFKMDDITGDEKRNIEEFWPVTPIKTKAGRLREANNIVHCVDKGFI
ncbi:uncharacterized protein LOC111000272 [Pieris rapae]|uniref:uncharacterized protein LOC111000272 n=1 Tax=Pieris rapae TaxID=64459 RepID=UPI001E27A61E|nr:uncharacterized protein LOC111000272 [Pieris rapae]